MPGNMLRFAVLGVVLSFIALVPACSSPEQPRAHFFLTTPRPAGARPPCGACLAEQPSRALRRGTGGSNAITVDGTKRFQRMDGFGYAMTDTSAVLIDRLPKRRRDALMRRLFDPEAGIGLSWMRVIMGPSDFTVVKPPWYSYRPSRTAVFDVGRSRFGSPKGDYSHIIPLLRQASLISDHEVTVFADPHSAPAWMKLNQKMSNLDPESCILGYCPGSAAADDVRTDYVKYFVDFVNSYEAAGVPIDQVGVQNEPGSPADFPSGDFAPSDQVDFAGRLERAFAGQDPPLKTKVLIEAVNPADALTILEDAPNPGPIDGVAYHCYFLTPEGRQQVLHAVAALHAAYPHQTLHETECTQDALAIWPKTIDMLIDHARNGSTSVAGWNLALDAHGGPQSVSCAVVRDGQCSSVGSGSLLTAPEVIRGAAGHATATETREYYETGQVTKFVRPGAVRLASNELGPMANVAFENRDGSRVLVVHNRGHASKSFAVNVGHHRHFDVDGLPGGAIATFIW